MDEQGASPPLMASCGDTPNADLMDINFSLDNTLGSEEDFLGHGRLQEDIEDDDGVPIS